MSFEEDFPSLADKKFDCFYDESSRKDKDMVFTEHIQEYCFDKQKVKEAMNKHIKDYDAIGQDYAYDFMEEVLKELGLEDDN